MTDVEFEKPKTVGQLTNDEEPVDSLPVPITNALPVIESEETAETSTTSEIPKDHVDDGGDVVVEGDEDTVIY